MTLPLSPEMLAAAYDYLCCQPPFRRWGLPPSEDVKFSVIKNKDRFAHYQMVGGVHHIAVSSRFAGRHETLLATISHELIHFRDTSHGKLFQRLADQVCKIHNFDRATF